MIQISKSLDTTIASATFLAIKLGATHNYEDILFLELISQKDSLCSQFLATHITAQQMQQIEVQIHRIVTVTYSPTELSISGVTPDIYYRDMLLAMSIKYPSAQRISTLHALHSVLGNRSSCTSQMLAKYGVTCKLIEDELNQVAPDKSIPPMVVTPIIEPHALSKFGVNLTAMAREGKIDPVIGREQETERVIEILSRRKKSNPVLVGEAGVGKSAIVEGLALRIAEGRVPHTIANKELFAIDISSLVAGTKFRGEFEQRMQELLTAIRDSRDTILFFDEIHTIVGAGSTEGSLDTANILKPALARGEIQVIGATTFDEYRKSIESDSALARRLQRVVIEPTSVDDTITILHRLAPSYEEHHGVNYTTEALEACAKLSDRYINDRQLPDKAIDVMDEAGSKAAISNSTNVSLRDIEKIITASTGIEISELSGEDMLRLRGLKTHLQCRVIGQPKAIESITHSIIRSRVGLADSARPIGVFMFVGPSGVGKTLLAKELSRWMFGGERSLIRIDMSEYNESHTISRLVGSPPGYVGYGEGGELTEAIRRAPYSVVLFDEIEKAHRDIYNIMLQIFDEGRLTDGSGRNIDFRNTIIIMTSNIGSREVSQQRRTVGYDTISRDKAEVSAPQVSYKTAIERRFSPELLNRIDDIIMFNSLSPVDIEQIVKLELKKIFERTEALGYTLRATPAAQRMLATLGYAKKWGARELRRTLTKHIEEPLSHLIINGELGAGAEVIIERVRGGHGVKLRVA